MDWKNLKSKHEALDKLRPFPAALIRNLDEWFRVELAYTSNAIEGNTLTRRETAIIIEKGLTIGGKSLTEHLEASNHSKAFDFIHELVAKKSRKMKEEDILRIHEIVLSRIDDRNAGRYRDVPVRISGSSVVLPNFRKIPDLMKDFVGNLNASNSHAAELASEAHYQLVTIQPFVDGNGRTARLLMNLILMMHGYPPAIIKPQNRFAYISALETAQLGGSKDPHEKMIFQAVDKSLDLYLRAVQGQEAEESDEKAISKRLKIGQLAKAVGVTVPTIRFWTSEGLLDVADTTESGYQLFDESMIERCRKIQRMKKKRMTIAEIKNELMKSNEKI